MKNWQKVEYGPHAILIKWVGIVDDDVCQPISLPEHTERSVHISGTFSGSATIALQSTNDTDETSATYASVKDADGTAISGKGAAFFNTVRDIGLHTKPVLTDGDGDTLINVYLLCRRNRP